MKLTNIEKLDRTNIVDFLEEIFERRGGEEYLGEPVTMAEHMLQGATIAEQNGQPEVIIVSVLLHDVGHFTSEFGMFSMDDTDDKYHEEAGAEVQIVGRRTAVAQRRPLDSDLRLAGNRRRAR